MARPWVVRSGRWTVSVFEHIGRFTGRRTDPTGHGRLLACGAALATMLVAARALGRDARWELWPDRRQPDEVGRIAVVGLRAPAPEDLALYRAVDRIAQAAAPVRVPAPLDGTRLIHVGGPRFVIVTDTDTSRDRVLAGMAAQRQALAARAAGWSVRLTAVLEPTSFDVPGRPQVEIHQQQRA